MTIRTRLLAILFALCLAMSACAYAEDASLPLVTIGDYVITPENVIQTAAALYQNGYTETENDYNYAIDYLVNQHLLTLYIHEQGLDQFSDEELASMRAEAEANWNAALDSYATYYASEDTDEARAAAREQAVVYYENTVGVTFEDVYKSYQDSAAFEKLEAILFADVVVDEPSIQALFDEYVNKDKQQFEGNAAYYEYYENYYNQKSWYRPSGYRGVLHILLAVDETLLNDYNAKLAGLEEETPEGEYPAVTLADVEAAYQAILDSVAQTTDSIYQRLSAGETFQALIAEYNTDPGMNDAATLAEGYPVHSDSILYDANFTAGAFSEKMTQVGAVSDPVVSSFGVHIMYYLSDIPGGAIELDDEIHKLIYDYLYNQACNEIFLVLQAEWIEQYNVTYDQAAIDALNATLTAPAATEVPAVDAPATEVPAVDAPATEVPATDAPVTDGE